jgi:hypothetical protein
MKALVTVVAIALLGVELEACAETTTEPVAVEKDTNALRSLTNTEARADFDQLVNAFRGLWGAMKRKEARYGFSFDALASEYAAKVAAASSDTEYERLYAEFIAHFKDAHVSLNAAVVPDEIDSFGLPLRVMPIEDTYVVYLVAPELAAHAPIARGDELLSIDGSPTAELVAQLSTYDGIPNPLSMKHLAANYLTDRPSTISGNIQDGDPVELKLRKPTGEEIAVTLRWARAPHVLPTTSVPQADEPDHQQMAVSESAQRAIDAEAASFGAAVPFYMTAEVVAAYHVAPVVPSDSAVDKFHVDKGVADSHKYAAYTYQYCGKKFLLLRLPDYVPLDLPDRSSAAATRESVNYLRALLADQQPLVDGLVFDQTHNRGGALDLAAQFVSLLTAQPVSGIVQEMHADRNWIGEYLAAAQKIRNASPTQPNPPDALQLEAYAHEIDLAYSNGAPLSAAIPFPGIPNLIQPDADHWSKPFIVLSDELSVSAADSVALMIKVAQLAPLFGQTTVGAGGSVESSTLTYSGLGLHLSRGLFTTYDPSGTYPESNFVEDVGVTPDIPYSHTLADFRAGYVGYVGAFSDALASKVDHP